MRKLILASLIALGFSSLAQAQNVECIVTKSVPQYKTIKVRTPHTTSYIVNVERKVPCGNSYTRTNRNTIGLDTVVGAAIGGIIGHQIGGGRGKQWATGGGALLGGAIANQSRNGYTSTTDYCTQEVTETRYRTDYTYETVTRRNGYKNYFRFNGKTYSELPRPEGRSFYGGGECHLNN